jgi:tetratricopeptide (TPR) repeat protein
MDEAFRKAVLDLRISVGLDGAPLLSYLHSMDIGRNLGLKQFDRDLLQAANRIDPHNFIVRRKYFYMLQTRWGGSVQEMKDELEDIRRHGASAEHLRELEIAVMEDQAWAYAYRDGDYQAAEREYEQILALQPDYYAALDGRVWVLVKMQRYGEVVEAATRILERLPNDPDAHYFRGYAYMKQNKATDALADYRVAANVGHAEAQAQLGRTYWHGDTGVPKDHVAALSWMRKAAAQGNEGAQRDLECALKEEK